MSTRCLLLSALPLALALIFISSCSDDESMLILDCEPGHIQRGRECVPDPRLGSGDDARGGEEDGEEDDIPEYDTVDPHSSCDVGERGCTDAGVPMICQAGEWAQQGTCSDDEVCVLGSCVIARNCEPGEVISCSNERQQLVCSSDGVRYHTRDCSEGEWCLDGICSERRCFAGETRCGDMFTVEECNDDELSYSVTEVCNANNEDEVCVEGECSGGCDFFSKTPTYIGCEYWAADLPNFDERNSRGSRQAAVVVANAGERTAHIRFETEDPNIQIPAEIQNQEVEPGSIAVLTLPDYNITGTSRSYKSFRLLMSEPMVVYQFKPWGSASLASNDATLLLPTNALGREYIVLSWPGGVQSPANMALREGDGQYGWFTVIAASQGPTNVEITFSADVREGPGMPTMRAGSTHEFEMYPGEVLNFEFEAGTGFPPVVRDATGSRVVADQPVAVFAGHKQAVIGPEGGESGCCADRLEHQLYPVEAWGDTYRVLKSPTRGGEVDRFRILAARDGTTITTDPPVPGLNGVTLNAGEFAAADYAQSFSVSATEPVLVGQYLLSQLSEGVGRTIGDPTFVLSVPRNQYRRSYLLAVPPTYREDYLVIAKPAGAVVRHNGVALDESLFSPLGSTGDVVGTVSVDEGAHRLVSSEPFGVQVFGYNSAVAYGYPGGLDLRGVRR